MLTDAELLHQAAADVRRLPAVTTRTLMDAIKRWCPDDLGRVDRLICEVVRHAAGVEPDEGFAEILIPGGPAALAAIMDRYAAELDRAAMMEIVNSESAAAELVAFVQARLEDDLRPARVRGNRRVLAEVQAKRRILERHAECGTGYGYCDDGGHGSPGGCADLKDAAAPYADHPDYRPEWRS
jgi:hypothetical protein